MKKYRFLSLFLSVVLTLALAPGARAAGSGSEILDAMHIDATAAVLIDADYGDVLYQQDAHEKRYPASITKVMTSLLVLELIDGRMDGPAPAEAAPGAAGPVSSTETTSAPSTAAPGSDGSPDSAPSGQEAPLPQPKISLDDVVTVGSQLHSGIGAGGSTADIKVGEQLTVKELLASALIPSANEACNALAEYVDGDVSKFVERMNRRAAELGMTGTHFSNAHGYHDDNHYTTAYDVALMCREAMKHQTFRELVGLKNYTLPATTMHDERIIRSTNALISNFKVTGYLYSKAIGIKTGHTPEAGYCLASAAYDDGKTLIAVVMGCEREPGTTGSVGFTYFSESSRLLEWGFQNFTRRVILDDSASHGEIPVTLGEDQNYVSAWPVGSVEATLPRDLDIGLFQLKKDCVETLEAPVAKGQKVGTITVTYNDQVYGTLDLVAGNDVARSTFRFVLSQIQHFFSLTWVRIGLLVIIMLVLVLILRLKLGGRRRRRYSGSRRRR